MGGAQWALGPGRRVKGGGRGGDLGDPDEAVVVEGGGDGGGERRREEEGGGEVEGSVG